MNKRRIGYGGTRLAWAALLLALRPAVAVTVHTWLDADGVRHYADRPPAEAVPASQTIEFALMDTPSAAADEYSIVNQWRRMRAERDADAARALERERLRLAARDVARVSDAQTQEEPRGYFYPGYGVPLWPYPGYGVGRPGRGGHGHDSSRRGTHFQPFPVPPWPRQR